MVGTARWLAVGLWVAPHVAAAQECESAGCQCNDGHSVSYSCWESENNPDACGDACRSSYAVGGGSPWWVDDLGRVFQGVASDQKRGAAARLDDLQAELDAQQFRQSDECTAALDQVETTMRLYGTEGEQYGVAFAQRDFARTLDRLSKAGRSPTAWEKAIRQLRKWSETIVRFSQAAEERAACLKSGSCTPGEYTEIVRRDLKRLMKELEKQTGEEEYDSAAAEQKAALQRVSEASTFLHDYGRRLTEAQMGNVALGATCHPPAR